jgi:integrase
MQESKAPSVRQDNRTVDPDRFAKALSLAQQNVARMPNSMFANFVKEQTIGGEVCLVIDFNHPYPALCDSKTGRVRKKAKDQTQRGAEAEARQMWINIELTSILAAEPPAPRLGDFIAVWWPEHAEMCTRGAPLEGATRIQYASVIRNNILPGLGDKRFDELTPPTLKAFFRALQTRTGMDRARRARTVLSVILNCAFKDQIIAHPIPLPYLKGTPREFDFLRIAEKPLFLAAAEDEWERCQLLFALDTGVRPSELAAVKLSDVDFELNRVKIERSFSRSAITPLPSLDRREPIRSLAGIKSTKNNRRRFLPLTAPLREALLRHSPRGSLLFGPTTILTQRVNAVLARAGLAVRSDGTPRRLRSYDLRHTYASHLAMSGVPLLRIRELLGHRSVVMTEVYAHLCPSRDVGGSGDDLGASQVMAALYPAPR